MMQTIQDSTIYKQNEQSLQLNNQLGIFTRLNGYLIEIILIHCSDLIEIQKNKLVCKFFAALLSKHLSIVGSVYDKPVPRRKDINEPYLILEIPQNIQQIHEIKIEVLVSNIKKSRSEFDNSFAYVVLRIIGTDSQRIIIKLGEQLEYFKVVKRIIQYKKEQLQIQEFFSQCSKAKQIGVFALSVNLGWETQIKKAAITLFYKKEP